MELVEKYKKIINTIHCLEMGDEPEEFILPNEDVLSAEFTMISTIVKEVRSINPKYYSSKEEITKEVRKILIDHYLFFEDVYGEENCPNDFPDFIYDISLNKQEELEMNQR